MREGFGARARHRRRRSHGRRTECELRELVGCLSAPTYKVQRQPIKIPVKRASHAVESVTETVTRSRRSPSDSIRVDAAQSSRAGLPRTPMIKVPDPEPAVSKAEQLLSSGVFKLQHCKHSHERHTLVDLIFSAHDRTESEVLFALKQRPCERKPCLRAFSATLPSKDACCISMCRSPNSPQSYKIRH
jgi:hypothetical protein